MLLYDRPARHKVIFTSQDHEQDQTTSGPGGPYGSEEWGKPVSIGESTPAGVEYRDDSPWSSPESKRRGPVYGSVM